MTAAAILFPPGRTGRPAGAMAITGAGWTATLPATRHHSQSTMDSRHTARPPPARTEGGTAISGLYSQDILIRSSSGLLKKSVVSTSMQRCAAQPPRGGARAARSAAPSESGGVSDMTAEWRREPGCLGAYKAAEAP